MTSYQDELPALYHNQGDGLFDDVAIASNSGQGTLQHVCWGNGFVDFDNDGDRDLYVAVGHLYDNADKFFDTTSHKVKNVVLENLGNGSFVDVSPFSGDGMSAKLSSRGAAFDDLDNDGDIDAVIVNSRDLPTILRNDTESKHHWIQLELIGTKTNRDAIGARVKLQAGDLLLVDEVHSGRGYESHYGTRLHFGLRGHEKADRIEIRWVGNPKVDVLRDVAVDQLHVIQETEGGAQNVE
jgi:hypothetical protein